MNVKDQVALFKDNVSVERADAQGQLKSIIEQAEQVMLRLDRAHEGDIELPRQR